MALSVTPLAGQLGAFEIYQSSTPGVPNNNVTSGAAGALQVVEINNSANVTNVYVKLYDNAGPTIGTTGPNWIFFVPRGLKRTFTCPGGSAFTNLSFACLTLAGTAGTAANANPPRPVSVRLVVT